MSGGRRQLLLAVDVGTTHCKAALFDAADGRLLRAAKRCTEVVREDGLDSYDPRGMWEAAAELIRETAGSPEGGGGAIAAVGITGMAESGLLVDRQDGAPRSPFIPWFSPRSMKQAERLAAEADGLERFAATGLHASFKYGLAKLMWLRDSGNEALGGGGASGGASGRLAWLSAPDLIAFRLTGAAATDYTLAARTFAFRIDRKAWDADWIRELGFDPALFPEALPAGTPVGGATAEAAAALGLPAGIPVVVAGHDHVCAALAAGAARPGAALDSMGTAETLVGMLPERKLGRREYESGLSFGCHLVPDAMFWMGGISASGGSVEWLRGVLAEETLSYGDVLALLKPLGEEPTGILYYPYLSGSGAPRPDARAKAAFVGLRASHGRGELLKAALEGAAYELESIRREAEDMTGTPLGELTVVGGGTRNRTWLRIKADVSGCTLGVPRIEEAALLGAALLAGVGVGLYRDAEQAAGVASAGRAAETFEPDAARAAAYRELYENGYMPLQQPLRAFCNQFRT